MDDWVKQLQTAGFPHADAQESQAGSLDAQPVQHRGPVDWRPTLSDLLAACPKEIGSATFVLGSSQRGKRWTATYFDFRNNRMVDDEALCQSADSPEEAVARLWLAQR